MNPNHPQVSVSDRKFALDIVKKLIHGSTNRTAQFCFEIEDLIYQASQGNKNVYSSAFTQYFALLKSRDPQSLKLFYRQISAAAREQNSTNINTFSQLAGARQMDIVYPTSFVPPTSVAHPPSLNKFFPANLPSPNEQDLEKLRELRRYINPLTSLMNSISSSSSSGVFQPGFKPDFVSRLKAILELLVYPEVFKPQATNLIKVEAILKRLFDRDGSLNHPTMQQIVAEVQLQEPSHSGAGPSSETDQKLPEPDFEHNDIFGPPLVGSFPPIHFTEVADNAPPLDNIEFTNRKAVSGYTNDWEILDMPTPEEPKPFSPKLTSKLLFNMVFNEIQTFLPYFKFEFRNGFDSERNPVVNLCCHPLSCKGDVICFTFSLNYPDNPLKFTASPTFSTSPVFGKLHSFSQEFYLDTITTFLMWWVKCIR